MRVVKPKVPIEVQGMLNRINSEAAFKTDMTVRDNVPKGGYFILHDVLYQALRAIPIGSTAEPGNNCVAKSLTELKGEN